MRGLLFRWVLFAAFFLGLPASGVGASGPVPGTPAPTVRQLGPDEEATSQGMRSGSMVSHPAARLARAMGRGDKPPSARVPPSPEATDGIALAVGKTLLYEDPSTHERFYRIDLSWVGGQSPYKVSTSFLPSFEGTNRTLALNLDATAFSVAADPLASLECFSISDDTFVSDSVQGIGYDTYPAPGLPSISINEKWWGDTVTVQSAYLDANPTGNLFGMDALKVKADSVTVGADGFGTEATFTIPEDARGTFSILEAHGLSSDVGYPLVLSPRGIGPFTEVRGVSYAPQTGHFWVAADDVIQEIDLFKHDPVVVRTLTGYAKPYISRVTNDGNLFFVEGVTGASMVRKVSVTGGAVSDFRAINDGSFTRLVTPVGIAAAPDESVAFIADKISPTGWQDRVVRIPQDMGTPINGYWGGVFQVPDPCGMDVGVDNLVYLSANFLTGWWIAYIKPTIDWPDGRAYGAIQTRPDICKSLEMDRDISTVTPIKNRFYWSTDPGMAHGYNQNEIADPAGPFPARYLGAEIYAIPSTQARNGMILSVEFMHSYSGPDGGPHISKRVILNNAGQAAPYLTRDQVADRIVKFQVRGFQGIYLLLRLIDPRDGAPYAPLSGWPPTDPTGHPAVSPYEARDNRVWGLSGYEDFGLSLSHDGGIQKELWVMILNDPAHPEKDYRDVYLKLPERFSGDNWQVEIRRMSPSIWTIIPNQVPTFTDVFTGWKRVFVERDKMFRRGGLLFEDFNAGSCSPNCNKIKLYDWANVADGDTIVIFDELETFEKLDREERIVSGAPFPNGDGSVTVTLSANLTKSYYKSAQTGSPAVPTFSNGHSGGVGVLSGCDASGNQLNASNSCFYDADMRDIQQPLNDGYAEIIGLADGMGVVPYIPVSIPFYDTNPSPPGPEDNNRLNFHLIWFKNNFYQNNCFQLIGCRGRDFTYPSTKAGDTSAANKFSYIFTHTMESSGQYFSYDALTIQQGIQGNTDHEIGHQFNLNRCSNPLSCDPPPPPPDPVPHIGPHDYRPWWGASSADCPNSNPCLMDPNGGNIWDTRNRLCKEDLLLGDPNCTGSNKDNSAVRTLADPLP